MAKVACEHCRLEFDPSIMIEEKSGQKDIFFCCKGCQGIYHLLKSEELDSFYEKAGNTKLTPPTHQDEDASKFDLEGFRQRYVKKRADALEEIYLVIEDIHCSACVWLNEKVLHQQEGIIEATINYSNHKARIVYDPEEIKLSQIITAIRAIGYNAFPYDPSLQEERATKQRKDYYARILVAVFATMNIMWIAIAQYTGYFTGMKQDVKDVLNFAEFILATPTLFYSGYVFFKGAYYGLKNRFVNMDVLVATGASLAYIYSIWAMVTQTGEVYFDSVTMIITFVLTGKYLEVLSKKQAVDTVDKLIGQNPTEVSVITKDGERALIAVDSVEVGDVIELRAGDKVVIDGEVLSGSATFDESSLTGESRPIYKEAGQSVVSGAIVIDGLMRYEVSKRFADSTLSHIISLLEEAVNKKPRIEQLANEISGYFSLIILSLSLLTFLIWIDSGFEQALITSIAVIVVACPCALGLATPMATLIGLAIGAKRGILFKEARFLETMAKADYLLLDKTGTLTKGEPNVTEYHEHRHYDKSLLYSLVSSSKHPISQGIKRFLEDRFEHLTLFELQEVEQIQAKGVQARYQNQKLVGGNEDLITPTLSLEGSLFLFSIDGELVASFALEDSIKEGAKEAIARIKAFGLKTVMLTGDNEEIARSVANTLGLDSYYAKMLPDDKAQFVSGLHEEKRVVIMVGDGINDTIALAKSDIAIAMKSGSDIAVDVSDVVLLDSSIAKVYDAILLSRRSFKAVQENLIVSVMYNVVSIPLAMLGYVTPLIAALAMSLSSLSVVFNSQRIKGITKRFL